MQLFTQFMHFASEAVNALFTPLSLQSLLQSLISIHSLLQSTLLLFEISNEEMELFSTELHFPPQWRQDIQTTVYTNLQNWIEDEFNKISQYSKEFISQIESINDLASMKRKVRQTSESIRKSIYDMLL